MPTEITDLDLGAFFSASASKDTPGTSAFDYFPIGRHSLKYSPRKQISKLRILALASFLDPGSSGSYVRSISGLLPLGRFCSEYS